MDLTNTYRVRLAYDKIANYETIAKHSTNPETIDYCNNGIAFEKKILEILGVK